MNNPKNTKRKQSYQKNEEYRIRIKEELKEKYHNDPEYRELKIRKAKEYYDKSKMMNMIKTQISNYFLRNGNLRYPNEEIRMLKGQDYKKGYEVRLVAINKKGLLKIKSFLKKAGFKPGKPFQKNTQFVIPIYGKEVFEKFLNFIVL